MNRTLLSAVIALSLTATLASAQQTAPAPSDSNQAPQGGYHHHRPNPHREAAMLSRRLNLTPDQTAKVEPILADRDQKLSTLRSDASLAPEARRTQMKSIHLDMQQQLSNILTPEQMQKMQSMRHRRGNHEQAPATPTGF